MGTPSTVTNQSQESVEQLSLPDRSDWTFKQKIQFDLGIWDGLPGSPLKVKELPPWNWVPNDDWRSLRGILRDHPEHDTTAMKIANREEEEEHDARKFGRSCAP